MEQVLTYIKQVGDSIYGYVMPLSEGIVSYVALTFGVSQSDAQIIVFGIIGYLIFVLIAILVHRNIVNREIVNIKDCLYQYDYIWYLIAQTMYYYNVDMKQKGQPSQLVHGIRSILLLEDKSYLNNKSKILADVIKLEQFISKKIVSDKIISRIKFLHTKIYFWKTFQKLIGWGITGLTLGVYKIFWNNSFEAN